MGAQPAAAPRVASVTEVTLALQSLVAGRFSDVLVRGQVTNARKV
jgi:hypothetical protein